VVADGDTLATAQIWQHTSTREVPRKCRSLAQQKTISSVVGAWFSVVSAGSAELSLTLSSPIQVGATVEQTGTTDGEGELEDGLQVDTTEPTVVVA
jgi:hypothetical protein